MRRSIDVLAEIGGDYPLLFSVKYFPGGAENIYKKAVVYSEENEIHKFILLDGDKKKVKYDPDTFTTAESENLDFIKSKLKEETSIDFQNLGFRIDGGNMGGNNTQKKESALNYLKFLLKNLEYFPKNIPEEIIWNENFAIDILTATKSTIPTFNTNFKKNIADFTRELYGNDEKSNIKAAQKIFINNFIKKKNNEYHQLSKILQDFKSHVKN
ncbi:hypothetical protein [Pedobacter nyackensis]|uniref:Uncharacterized protein n=1 Tax=Pedobacter nyackensis TaxID=475255 RepID=A0A1W2EGC6_9SPHI|nr:hypothetical protein [Pedobacter nyackensis]SMD08386.1 hypothetical protein SAMN04488101_11218 [Pedobacter nyackensis]